MLKPILQLFLGHRNMRFLHRHADADLLNVITTSVPPMDLSKVMIFNTHLLKYNSEVWGDGGGFSQSQNVHQMKLGIHKLKL